MPLIVANILLMMIRALLNSRVYVGFASCGTAFHFVAAILGNGTEEIIAGIGILCDDFVR